MTIRRVEMKCPYSFCHDMVSIHHQPKPPFVGGKESWIIENHEINHPILRGLCPASLMHWPLNEEARIHLQEQQDRDIAIIASHAGKTLTPKTEILPTWKKGSLGIIGGGSEMSAQETVAALNEAAIKVGEARGVISQSQEPIAGAINAVESAQQLVQAAKGDIESPTLNEYIGLLHQAEEALQGISASLEDIRPKLGAALELGEDYAGRLQG